MKIISLNVNGLKSSINKGLEGYLKTIDFDILCLQEIKCTQELLKLEGYNSYYNFYGNGGYSGTAILTRITPLSVQYDISESTKNLESRIITLEFKNYYLVNVYVPNSKSGLSRINYRMYFDDIFYEYLVKLDRKKPIIVCGDFNVSLQNKEENFFDENIVESFMDFLDVGFLDSYSEFHDNDKYTWYFESRNIGYRLDYFIVSEYLKQYLIDSNILENIKCSDHIPIILEVKMNE